MKTHRPLSDRDAPHPLKLLEDARGNKLWWPPNRVRKLAKEIDEDIQNGRRELKRMQQERRALIDAYAERCEEVLKQAKRAETAEAKVAEFENLFADLNKKLAAEVANVLRLNEDKKSLEDTIESLERRHDLSAKVHSGYRAAARELIVAVATGDT